jgi:hypothetical protein
MSSAMPGGTNRTAGGWLAVVAGLGTAAVIYARPEGLNAPAWVAYTACAAFVFAGLCIVAAESRLAGLHAWLSVATIAAMLGPGAWVAFGPGARPCTFSLPFVTGPASGWVCRCMFGFGAVVLAGLLVWAVRLALRGRAGA